MPIPKASDVKAEVPRSRGGGAGSYAMPDGNKAWIQERFKATNNCFSLPMKEGLGLYEVVEDFPKDPLGALIRFNKVRNLPWRVSYVGVTRAEGAKSPIDQKDARIRFTAGAYKPGEKKEKKA